jgi:hypothetical protein
MMLVALLIAVVLGLSTSQDTRSPCAKQSTDEERKSDAPFLCSFEADILLESKSCTTVVIETLVLPYTTGNDAFREIAFSSETQSISNVSVKRGNTTINVSQDGEQNPLKIIIPTLKERSPVTFVIRYRVTQGISSFKESCINDVAGNASKRVAHWRPGSWDKSFDKMTVTFRSEKETNLTLFEITPTGTYVEEKPRKVRSSLGSVTQAATSEIELYVTTSQDDGTCETVATCITQGKSWFPKWLYIVLVVCCCLICGFG